jgi:hypothetical protein
MQLNIEIHCFPTYIHDEDHFLLYSEMKVRQTNP